MKFGCSPYSDCGPKKERLFSQLRNNLRRHCLPQTSLCDIDMRDCDEVYHYMFTILINLSMFLVASILAHISGFASTYKAFLLMESLPLLAKQTLVVSIYVSVASRLSLLHPATEGWRGGGGEEGEAQGGVRG